ncbi:cyclin [Salvia divinorum]|uniref:Cyclin n=1 Tax=Salvia divinorum TaxID=28513 RepID=A0ABD1I6Y0_SALDI
MAIEQTAEKSLVDALYCEEETWGGDVDDNDDDTLSLLLLEQQDLFWEDEELQSLFSKETQTRPVSSHHSLSPARKESVHWILKINAHYAFSPLTAILAVNYLDRFLCCVAEDKPWMMQLAAVTCLSLAAKVQETHVPLLLDLQVEETKYVFESKTVQRMELLVLSALQWRMNPVTPVSFLDHIIRRLGLKSHLHWEFLTTCQNLLLSVASDPRFTLYLPSVLATATMLHVIHGFEPRRAVKYETQLLGVLKINKEEVDECYEVIREVLHSNTGFHGYSYGLKRKICQVPLPGSSPDAAILNSDSSWSDSSDCKKARVEDHQMRLPSLTRVFLASPH